MRAFIGYAMFFFWIVIAGFSQKILAQSDLYREGEVLVRYLSSVSLGDRESLISSFGAETIVKHQIVPNLELIRLPQGKNVTDAVSELEETPGVLYASPNYIVTIDAGIFPPRDFPNDPKKPRKDPFFYRSYGINLIQSPKAWDAFTMGNRDILIGVIDTGIDYTHEDLAPNIWKNKNETPDNGVDDDHNGYVDDVYGWNFVNNTNNPFDDNRHGTHVAGTIGAVEGNLVGTIGASPKVSLMASKFLDNQGRGSLSGAIQAIDYAVSNGAKILNNSWGGRGFSQALLDAIRATELLGVLFVAAAGNDSLNNDEQPVYPASFDVVNIISVAATDRYDKKASFSNYGTVSVDLGAPGVNVYSTLPFNRYGNMNGTSMSTPHVTGSAALIMAYKPTLSVYDLKDLILTSVDPVDSLKGLTVTGGRMNVYNAMALGLLSF